MSKNAKRDFGIGQKPTGEYMMMMMMLHLPFILSLFALGMGVCLYVWSLRNKGAGVNVAKFFGIIIIVLSLLSLICVWYTAFNFQRQMPMRMMQGKAMSGQGNMQNGGIPQHEKMPPEPHQ